jgi:copper homeostasis protein
MLLEIVASTVNDCIAAESGGADRIELCAAIAEGGLTPSMGTLVEAKKRVRIPVMAMARPRTGGFFCSEAEFAVMRRDAAFLLEHGADGIVFGILHSDGSLDTKRCGKMLELAGERQTVFHRAFDIVPDPFRALDGLIDLGFTRVLTSGQKQTALEGGDLIRKLVDRADGRIEVLPGSGIRAHNVRQLIDATGCTQVHMTAFVAVDPAAANSQLEFGRQERTDSGRVRQVKETLNAIGQNAE